MKHQQILDKLGVRGFVKAMDEELATGVALRMRPANRTRAEIEAAVIPPVLNRAPVPLTRRPRRPRELTFFRPGDVISFQLAGRFHGGDPGPTGRIWTYADLFGLQHDVRTLFGDGGRA